MSKKNRKKKIQKKKSVIKKRLKRKKESKGQKKRKAKKIRKRTKAKKTIRRKKEHLTIRRIKIKVIGLGGGAASILREIASSLKGVSFLLFDTDQRSFKKISSKIQTFQFGQEITRGWGTGMNPEIAERVAEEVKEKIKKNIQGADLVILVSCLGGGVGSGASLVVSRLLRKKKILSLGIFTLPFSFEGEKKMRLAKESLRKLKDNLSGIIVLPNEKILEYSDKKFSLKKSLSLMNRILIDYLKDLIEMISLPGIINIDFADFKTVLKGRGDLICFGGGTALGPNRIEEALKEVFENPFFICPTKLKRILFNISNGRDLALKEVEEVAQRIFKLNPRAKIIFGISQNQASGKKVKITFLGTGENYFGKGEEKIDQGKKIQTSQEKKKKLLLKDKNQIKKKKTRKKKERAKKKIKIRRSALEVKKAREEAEEKEWARESEWEIPSFLRKHIK